MRRFRRNRWNEFGAIVGDSTIPQKLGTYALVEKIERIGEGSYRVSGAKCSLTVALSRKAPTGPQGQPIVGGSVVTVASVSEPRCS